MSTSQPQTAPTPEVEDSDMADGAPDSPVEPTAAQLQASGAFIPEQAQQQQQSPNTANSSKALSTEAAANGHKGDKGAHGAPGSTWSSKKFAEEYEQAVGRLCHQEYEPAKYGDPLLQ